MTGSNLLGISSASNAAIRFYAKVNKYGAMPLHCPELGRCWVWIKGLDKKGYGKFRDGGKNLRAHRFAYSYFVGQIPEGLCVLHRCDVPNCVNPSHLFLGTNADNSADMTAKGRQAYGERNGLAKLTDELVGAIRVSTESNVALAKELGMTETPVRFARTGKSWKHVK